MCVLSECVCVKEVTEPESKRRSVTESRILRSPMFRKLTGKRWEKSDEKKKGCVKTCLLFSLGV